jgi:hypothetical protein
MRGGVQVGGHTSLLNKSALDMSGLLPTTLIKMKSMIIKALTFIKYASLTRLQLVLARKEA